MPARKRAAPATAEPVAKRRSSRQTAPAAAVPQEPLTKARPAKKQAQKGNAANGGVNGASDGKPVAKKAAKKAASKVIAAKSDGESGKRDDAGADSARDVSEDPDVASIPAVNPEAPRHKGEWYWLMKAEPETRMENGIDVSFSIDDLRAKTRPEGWDGIRAYPARNHMRNMNAGDKAFFYHSNCKEPGIFGVMEIVKEFSEDKSARRPGTPYYDPSSTRDSPRWSLVHVEFRRKFAVPIYLKELRELGQPGRPLEQMQMLKQTRLSVSRVSEGEWAALCKLADEKAREAGLEHEEGK